MEATSPAEGEHGPDSGRDWCSPGRFALVLALLISIPFCKVLSGAETFAVRDFGIFSYPNALFQRECFWRGELPWWNPNNCCGLPFLAQFNTLSLYPPALVYLLLPLTWSLPFFCLLHLFLGGMGMYFLAARWSGSRAGAALAGAAFAFNGLSLNFLMWPSHIATFAWMPWVILLTEAGWREGGRKIALAAVVAALQVLAGGPEEILFTWLILALLALAECRRQRAILPGRRFLLVGLLAGALAATQWLPFAEFALHSSRNNHYAASEWSMPAAGWANFLVPRFQTTRWQGLAVQHDQYWTSSYYAGIGVLFLAALAVWQKRDRRVWLVGALVVASLVLALGDHGLVYLWLRRIFPVFGYFRYPIKFIVITSLLLPLLAAFAISQYENLAAERRRPRRAEVVCAGAMVLAIGAILFIARHHPAADSSWPETLSNGLGRLAFLAAFLGAVYFFAAHPARRRWSVLLLPVICWLDLITAMPWQNPSLDPSVYQPGLGEMKHAFAPKPTAADSRLVLSSAAAGQLHYHPLPDLKSCYLLDRAMYFDDCNLIDNLAKVDGFFSLYLRESDKILWLLDGRSGAELDSLEDFLGVSQTIAPGTLFDWMPRTNYLPIVTAGQEPVFADDAAAFSAIGKTNVDFRNVVYLPSEARSRVMARRQPAARIIDKQFGAGKASIQVDSPGTAMVYLSEAYYRNWKADVDGTAVPLWRANYAFQAVEVPAGKHTVTLVYRDKMFQVGLFLTAWAGLLCVLLWLAPKPAR